MASSFSINVDIGASSCAARPGPNPRDIAHHDRVDQE
jgi:hypothetical protein